MGQNQEACILQLIQIHGLLDDYLVDQLHNKLSKLKVASYIKSINAFWTCKEDVLERKQTEPLSLQQSRIKRCLPAP